MLVSYFQAHGAGFCFGSFLFFIALWLCIVIAYRMNKRLPSHDEDKQDYHIRAVWLAPLTLFPILAADLLALLVFTFFFGMLLIALPFGLVFPRLLIVVLKWLIEKVQTIGDFFLKVNMKLLREAGFLPMPANT